MSPTTVKAALNQVVPTSDTTISVNAVETDTTVSANWTLQAFAICINGP